MAAKSLTARFCESVRPTGGSQTAYPDADVRGLELRVSGEGRKSWSLRYRTAEGVQRRVSLGVFPAVDLGEARKAALVVLGAVAGGGDPAADKRRARHKAQSEEIATFGDLMRVYFDACERGLWTPRNKRKRATTLARERTIYRRYLEATLGAERLDDLSRGLIRNAIRKLTLRGITAQARQAQQLVRQALNFAVSEDRLTVNPAAGLQPAAPVVARERVLDDAELRTLWAGLGDRGELRLPEGDKVQVGDGVALAVKLGVLLLQRRGEIAAMERAEVDLDRRVWTVPAAKMKGGRPHVVPFGETAASLIREAMALGDDEKPSRWVFPSPKSRGAKAVRPDTLSHALRDVSRALGIENATFHDLRRTGSTAMTSERIGVTPFARSLVLGHASDTGGGAQVSSAHYDVNDYLPEKRRALEAWEALVVEIVTGAERPSNVAQFGGRGR